MNVVGMSTLERKMTETIHRWREHAETLRFTAHQFMIQAGKPTDYAQSHELRLKARTMESCADEVEKIILNMGE